MSADKQGEAMFKGIGAGLLATSAIGLVAGLVAVVALWTWPTDLGEGFAYLKNSVLVVLSGLVVGGAIGLVIGTSLAWHGGIIGSTLDRGDAAPLYGVLTGIVLGGALSPVLGGVVGLVLGQLVGGVLLGLILGPIVGIVGWETAFWAADHARASAARH